MAMPIAVGVVTWRLLKEATWADAKRLVVGAATLALVGAITSVISMGVLLSNSRGTFGPDVPVGWPNRFELATYSVWFLVVARRAGGIADR